MAKRDAVLDVLVGGAAPGTYDESLRVMRMEEQRIKDFIAARDRKKKKR